MPDRARQAGAPVTSTGLTGPKVVSGGADVKAELVRIEAGDGLELVRLYSAPPGATARRAVLHTHGLAGNFYENRFIADVCAARAEDAAYTMNRPLLVRSPGGMGRPG